MRFVIGQANTYHGPAIVTINVYIAWGKPLDRPATVFKGTYTLVETGRDVRSGQCDQYIEADFPQSELARVLIACWREHEGEDPFYGGNPKPWFEDLQLLQVEQDLAALTRRRAPRMAA